MERELCGKYMPRAKKYCARWKGHKANCLTRAAVDRLKQRTAEWAREHPEIKRLSEARYRSTAKRKLVLARYRGTAKGMLTAMRSNARKRGNR